MGEKPIYQKNNSSDSGAKKNITTELNKKLIKVVRYNNKKTIIVIIKNIEIESLQDFKAGMYIHPKDVGNQQNVINISPKKFFIIHIL